MHRKQFDVVEGQVWHFGSITEAGQYGDFFLPLMVSDAADLLSDLKDQRHKLLDEIGNDSLEVASAPFKAESQGKVLLRLKWKEAQVDSGSVVLFGPDDEPLTATNQEMQDAIMKVSFSQFSWEYKGRVGTKLVPRKVKLLEFARMGNLDIPTPEALNVQQDF